MKFIIRTRFFILKYTLDTFNQVRKIGCAFSATSPGAQLNSRFGALPNPWALPCEPNEMFKNHSKTIPIPNTDLIQVKIIDITLK